MAGEGVKDGLLLKTWLGSEKLLWVLCDGLLGDA